MGLGSLFGFGEYSKKTFEKNTKLFKARIEELMHIVADNKDGRGKSYPVGAILTRAIMSLDVSEYKSFFNSRDIQAVDERISGLLDLMQKDLAEGSMSALSAHAEILFDAITDARRAGHENATADELAVSMRMVELLAKMEEIVGERKAVQDRISRIVKSVEGLGTDDPKYALCEREVLSCEERLNMLEETYVQFDEEYQVQSRMVTALQQKRFYDSLESNPISPERLELMLDSYLGDAGKKQG